MWKLHFGGEGRQATPFENYHCESVTFKKPFLQVPAACQQKCNLVLKYQTQSALAVHVTVPSPKIQSSTTA